MSRVSRSFLVIATIVGCHARVVSVADLHGDFDRTVEILKAADLIDDAHEWIAGKTTLVQTGDITDRGDHAKQIYELFSKLTDQAKTAGGRVVNLLGNHELMNIEGHWDYVSQGDIEQFGDEATRREAWGPDGSIGKQVRQFPAAVVVDGVLFAHAGPLPQNLGVGGLEGMNKAIKRALSGADRSTSFLSGADTTAQADDLLNDDGPMWTRVYAQSPESTACADVRKVLSRVGATRLVVGHTVQPQDRTRCGGRVLLADTGISSVFEGGRPSFVEHENGDSWAVYPSDSTRHLLPRPDGTM